MDWKKQKVTVVGMGNVGMPLGVVLTRACEVTVTDIDEKKVRDVQKEDYRSFDPEIQACFAEKGAGFYGSAGSLKAASIGSEAYGDADHVFVAVSTDFDEVAGGFDTSALEEVIRIALAENREGTIVIRSTIPLGFTERMRKEHDTDRILFAPEFLREGRGVEDTLHPSRIVIGGTGPRAEALKELLLACAAEENVPCVMTGLGEAEAIKLLSNTYLAMRVAFFNEVDTLAEDRGLNAGEIIDGMGLDPRIGDVYNNPSFGYGGYCLPKDVKQAAAAFAPGKGELIGSIDGANTGRITCVAEEILSRRPKTVGIYRIGFKHGSSSPRKSAVLEILGMLREAGTEVIIYEPECTREKICGADVLSDLGEFCRRSDVIAANRMSKELKDYREKVYTRDLYGEN